MTNKYAVHKLWAWCSLSINIIVSAIIYSSHTRTNDALITGIIMSVICLTFGVIKIRRDAAVNELSVASTVISYVCSLLISIILLYLVY